tara:strand:+ start:9350 stop:10756 length:1407 start_codon:yes stop_codon:yes gene_type:complete
LKAAIATSDPRATEAGVEILKSGGNAVDAAVTAAFLLYVVEPQSCGIGGDAFLMIGRDSETPIALDGSGALPVELTSSRLLEDGLDAVPARGGKTATPPGATRLLEEALARFGTISLRDAVSPARSVARNGFVVHADLAAASQRAAKELASDPVLGPLYSPDGKGVDEGVLITNPGLSECLETIADLGSNVVLEGAIANQIVDFVRADGGYLSDTDLKHHRTLEITAENLEFSGYSIWQLPAPTQGPAVLHALRHIKEHERWDWNSVLLAVRQGMQDAGFDPGAVVSTSRNHAKGDTTYLAVIDEDRTAVSLITSIFGDFGSHLGIPAIGGPIHNRATTLRMLQQPPRPGKPPHTTIPGLALDNEGNQIAFGVAGGLMQPQAQVQLLIRMLLEGLGPQDAIDAPRFKICFGGSLAIENGHELAKYQPDALAQPAGPEGFGAAQIVQSVNGRLFAGADRRRGGASRVLP